MKETNFHVTDGDNPEAIVIATQQAVFSALRTMIEGIEKDAPPGTPGLRWKQIYFLLDEFKNKKPTVVVLTDDGETH